MYRTVSSFGDVGTQSQVTWVLTSMYGYIPSRHYNEDTGYFPQTKDMHPLRLFSDDPSSPNFKIPQTHHVNKNIFEIPMFQPPSSVLRFSVALEIEQRVLFLPDKHSAYLVTCPACHSVFLS